MGGRGFFCLLLLTHRLSVTSFVAMHPRHRLGLLIPVRPKWAPFSSPVGPPLIAQPRTRLFSAVPVSSGTLDQSVQARRGNNRRHNGPKLHWSPSDMMLFMKSPFACWMERLVREQPNHKWAALARKEGLLDASANDDPMRAMLSEQGSAAELRFFESQFKTQAATSDGGRGVGMVVEDLSQVRFDNVDATVSAMERGVDVIFQAPLSMPLPLPVTAATAATQADATVATAASPRATAASPRALEAGALGFCGVADFLVKVPLLDVKEGGGRQVTTAGIGGEGGAMEVGNSGAEVGGSRGSGDGGGSSSGGLGVSWTYEVWDAKFAKRAEPSHVLQLWCYSEMVAAQVAQSLKKKQQLRTSQTTTTTTTPMPTVMSKTQGNGATAKTTVMSTHTTKAESAELSAESVLPHSRGCLVLNVATTINPIELAPYGAYYRDLKER